MPIAAKAATSERPMMTRFFPLMTALVRADAHHADADHDRDDRHEHSRDDAGGGSP